MCGDITDVKAVRAASTGVDLIIHMAAKIDFKGLVSEEILHNINVQGNCQRKSLLVCWREASSKLYLCSST